MKTVLCKQDTSNKVLSAGNCLEAGYCLDNFKLYGIILKVLTKYFGYKMLLNRLFQIIIIGLTFCLVYSPVLSDNVSALIRTTATVEIPAGIIPYATYKENTANQIYASISDNIQFKSDNNLFFLWQPSEEYVINFQIEKAFGKNDENLFIQINQDYLFTEKVNPAEQNSVLNFINLNSIDEKLPFDYTQGIITLISIDN